MAKLGNVSNSWAQIISSMVNMPAKKTIWSVVQRLVLEASVYFIWQERNFRLFRNGERSEDVLFKFIFEFVGYRLMGLKLKTTPDVIKASEVWNIPIDRMHKYKNILDELMTKTMDLDDDN
nr:reverse transcriptase zinc-binding domain-containing protein [Tanacetum cinerariifolium]